MYVQVAHICDYISMAYTSNSYKDVDAHVHTHILPRHSRYNDVLRHGFLQTVMALHTFHCIFSMVYFLFIVSPYFKRRCSTARFIELVLGDRYVHVLLCSVYVR